MYLPNTYYNFTIPVYFLWSLQKLPYKMHYLWAYISLTKIKKYAPQCSHNNYIIYYTYLHIYYTIHKCPTPKKNVKPSKIKNAYHCNINELLWIGE